MLRIGRPCGGLELGALALCVVVFGGCDGISSASTRGASTAPDAPRGPGGGGGVPDEPVLQTCTEVPVGPASMRRLTNREYDHTVQSLFGVGWTPSREVGLLPDNLVAGFDNNVDSQSISLSQAERYAQVAERVAGEVVGSAALRSQVIGCDLPSGGAPCLRAFVETLTRRAFRREPAADEVQALVALAQAAPAEAGPYGGAQRVIRALLESPSFLYRVEETAAAKAPSGDALATRLSYLLWGVGPSHELLTAAQAGELETSDGVRRWARKLLEDPRAKEAVRSFYAQWLQLEQLDHVMRDPARFALWNDALRASMARETEQLLDGLIWTPGSRFTDFVDARHTFVDAKLAQLYGLPAPAAGAWVRAELAPQAKRGGVLTHASVLTVTSHADAATAIRRGKYVREVLLCEELPPPPPNAGTVPTPTAGQTDREALAQHRADPACAGCHTKLDPLGFGLSEYDAIGQLQVEQAGKPIDASGTLFGFAEPSFVGGLELGDKLARSPQVTRCAARQLFRYAFGRLETPTDECFLDGLSRRMEATNADFLDLVVELAASPPFREPARP